MVANGRIVMLRTHTDTYHNSLPLLLTWHSARATENMGSFFKLVVLALTVFCVLGCGECSLAQIDLTSATERIGGGASCTYTCFRGMKTRERLNL